MRAAVGLIMLVGVAVAASGCARVKSAGESVGGLFNKSPGYSVEFIAGNSYAVLIDYARGSDTELQEATKLATNRCQLFGQRTAVLESINPRSDDKARASFLCQ
jgi:hypothetical protein